jgi:hypothetical protein
MSVGGSQEPHRTSPRDYVLFAIKAARSGRQPWVQSIKVIRRPDEKESIIALQPIKLIKEERAILVDDMAIKVFQDDDTW